MRGYFRRRLGSILIDSGSDAHVVPQGFFRHWGIKPSVVDKKGAALHTIDGSKIQIGSVAIVWINLFDESGQTIRLRVRLIEGGVSMGVLSAGLLEDSGVMTNLGDLSITFGNKTVRMRKEGKKYAVHCSISIVSTSSSSANHAVPLVAPLEVGDERTQSDEGLGSEEAVAEPGGGPEQGEHEPGEAEPVFDERSKVTDLKTRLRELNAPTWGAKADLLRRVAEYIERRAREPQEQQELEERHKARLEGQPMQPFKSRLLAPAEPTPLERELHELTHLPTANWCEHCLQGKAKSAPHGQQHPVAESNRRPPSVQIDFMYMAGAGEDDPPRCFLTMLDEQTHYPFCMAMPGKTVTEYMVEVVLDSRLGHQVVVLYSDGEPAVYNLMTRVQGKRGAEKTLLKHTPRYSSQSLGRLGACQQMIQGMIRTLKVHLESKYSRKLPVKDHLFTWLTRHAAWLLARFHTRAGQQTSYEINNGVAYAGKIVAFGETVMFKHPMSSTGALAKHIRRAKAETTWEKGIWLGKTERGDEHIVCTALGCYRTRDVRRLPLSSQTSLELFRLVPCPTFEPKWGKPPGRVTRSGPPPIPEDVGEEEPEGTSGIPPTPPLIPSIPVIPATLVERQQEDEGRAKRFKREASEVKISEDPREAGISAPPREAGVSAPGVASSSGSSGSSSVNLPSTQVEIDAPNLLLPPTSMEQADIHDEEDEPRAKRTKTVGGVFTLDSSLVPDEEHIETMRRDALTDHPEEGPDDPLERKVLLEEGTNLELDRLEQFRAFKPVPRPNDQKVIATRWVYRFKRDKQGKWFGRARFVAKDFASWVTSEFFAPTTGVSTARVLDIIGAKLGMKHFGIDASNAFLHVPVDSSLCLFVEAPEEWQTKHDPDKKQVWQLQRWLYGMRGAPQAWIEWMAAILQGIGFERSIVEPCFFRKGGFAASEDAGISDSSGVCDSLMLIELHMDDIHGVCADANAIFKEKVQVKCEGPFGEGDAFVHLKRSRRLRQEGVYVKPCSLYADRVLELLDLATAKPTETPAVSIIDNKEVEEKPLDSEQASVYRTCVGKLLYLSLDRQDIAFATKELARGLKAPTKRQWTRLKRLARYVRGTVGAEIFISSQGDPGDIQVYSDSDFAGCKKTRKSTTGIIAFAGGSPVMGASRSQAVVSTSSAEAELYALSSAGSEAVHLKDLFSFLLPNKSVTVTLKTDSQAAIGIIQRLGRGRVKHLDVRALWLQEYAARGRFVISKVPGEQNPADLMTKAISGDRFVYLRELCGVVLW